MAQVGNVDRFATAIDVVAEIGRDESVIALQKQAKTEFADGVMQVAQGGSLTEIEQEQPWYNKVFGPSATLLGAETQTAVAGVNQYFSDEASFLETDEGRAMSPDQYRERQSNSMKAILTGHDRVDTLLTAELAPKLGSLADAQVKANRAYVNEQNVISMGNNILTQANTVNKLAASNGWSHQLVAEAKAGLSQTLSSPPEGMDQSSYRKLLAQSVLTNYAQGSDIMDLATKEMGVQFTPSEILQIADAKASFLSSKKAEINLQADASYGKIAAGVDNGTITTAPALIEQLNQHKTQFNDLGQRSTRALFRKLHSVQGKQKVLTDNSEKVLRGQIHQVSGKKDQQEAYQHAKKRINDAHPATPEGREAAIADQVRLWHRNGAGIVDEQLKAQLGHLQTGFNQAGEVDPNYIKHFELFSKYYEADPDRALSHLTGEPAQLRAQGVMTLLDDGLADNVEDALRIVQTQYNNPVDKAHLGSREFNDSLSEAVDTATSSKWSWFVREGQEEIAGKAVASQWIRSKAKALVTIGGSVKDAVKTATALYSQGFDVIQGVPIHKDNGIPMRTRMGLYEGSVSAQEAIETALARGFNGDRPMEPGDYTILSTFKDTLIVQVNDPDDPEFTIGTRSYNLKEIGLHANTRFQTEFTAEAILADKVQQAVTDHSINIEALRELRKSQGFTAEELTDEILTRELEENHNLNMAAERFLEAQMTETKRQSAASADEVNRIVAEPFREVIQSNR